MVDLYNIKWDGQFATADLAKDASKVISYTITVDCKTGDIIQNSNNEVNSFIAQARNRLCDLYEEGKKPTHSQVGYAFVERNRWSGN